MADEKRIETIRALRECRKLIPGPSSPLDADAAQYLIERLEGREGPRSVVDAGQIERAACAKMVRDFADFWKLDEDGREMLETIARCLEKPFVPVKAVS
ncbi:MAG: hypothetical protein AB7G62_01265 [Magnetospirillum sp.]